MKEEPQNGERKVATAIGLYTLRSINTIFALVAAAGIFWIKANVPSKEDFKELHTQIRALELTVVQLGRVSDRLEKLEERLLKLESERRGPPPLRREP